MKKLKFVFWLLFIVFFGLLFYQNLGFFSAKNSLQIDLGVYQRSTPELANGVIIAGFVGIGVFIMLILYFSSRFTTYKANKIIKELKNDIEDRTSAIASLKEELEALKQSGSIGQEAIEETLDSESQIEEADTQTAQSSQA
jgi:uncharacterized membrane protein YciS (DUF1049 family)